MTSSVEECALRARSTHGVHHAIVEVNIVIGAALVARVVPLVVDAVFGLTLVLIAHVVIVVLRRIHFTYNFPVLEKNSLHSPSVTVNCCWLLPNRHCNSASN